MIAATREEGSRKGLRESVTSKATRPFYYARPFAVRMFFFGLPKSWGFYSTAAEADAAIVQLKRHGFQAERVT